MAHGPNSKAHQAHARILDQKAVLFDIERELDRIRHEAINDGDLELIIDYTFEAWKRLLQAQQVWDEAQQKVEQALVELEVEELIDEAWVE
jgi:glycine betaine/choline ABC-type transport system substrate-binding protein